MRNPVLHDALRDFAVEAAGLLTEEQRVGAELEFDVENNGGRRGPTLYRYRPLTERYIGERWSRLRELPSCGPAAAALGAGAASWLRVNGLRGAQAEPALQAMLERLFEDATSFHFPEERFERVYAEVELTLYRDTIHATVAAALHGLEMDAERVELAGGLSLVRVGTLGAPLDPNEVACVLERDVSPEGEGPDDGAEERFRELLTALRLFKAGRVALGTVGWRRSGESRWRSFEIQGDGPSRGDAWVLAGDEEAELRDFLGVVGKAAPGGAVGWALGRFEMGCSRRLDAEALPDYLLALRALLDAGGETGPASLGLRLAALCAEEGQRRNLQQRVDLALSLERYVMGGGRGQELRDWIGSESPRQLVLELERHTRALLRDILCGYLEPNLKSVADDILLERGHPTDPLEIEVRDLRQERSTDELEPAAPRPRRITAEPRRREPEPEPAEPEPQPADPEPQPADPELTEAEPEPELELAEREAEPAQPEQPEPEQHHLEGVTASADWGPVDEDPDSYSAPV